MMRLPLRCSPWCAHTFATAITLGLVTPRAASAAEPSFDARTWRPSTSPEASLVIEPATTEGPAVMSASVYGHWAWRPITLRSLTPSVPSVRVVSQTFGIDPTFNVGIGKRLALGVAVPVIVMQEGQSSSALARADQAPASTPSSALGDVGISVKGLLVAPRADAETDPSGAHTGGFRLAALGYFTAPTGNRSAFAGEGAPTATVRALADYTLLVASVQASVGYKVRTERRTWPGAEAGGVRLGDEIPWSFGLMLRPGVFKLDPGHRQKLEVAVHGWLPAGPVGPFGAGAAGSAALSPVLLALSDRIELGRYHDAFITVGAELGLTQALGTPAARGVIGFGWTPRSHDQDNDGIKDDLDGCPEIAEDLDGFEDQDGCPDPDNDDDGIIDRLDRCPNEAGVEASDPARNGCPVR